MNRQAVVDLLHCTYRDGGLEGLAPILDLIRRYGPLHDPEWITCPDCGAEHAEQPANGKDRANQYDERRCSRCDAAVDAARR